MPSNIDKNITAREAHLRVILSLRKMLNVNKSIVKKNKEMIYERPDTYRDIYYKSDIREATVSDTFNGKTMPNAVTLLLIIEAMGYNINDFAKIYHGITSGEIAAAEMKVDKRDYFRS